MFVFQGVLRAGHGGGSGACASLYGCIAAKEEAKGRGRIFLFAFCASGRQISPPFWTNGPFGGGEMLDERIERPNETLSFVLLNGEDTPFCDSYTQRVPLCPPDCLLVTITPAFTFILVTACVEMWAQGVYREKTTLWRECRGSVWSAVKKQQK